MEFDFEKNATVESIDTVPEQYRGLYIEITEGDNTGKFGVADHAKGIVKSYIGVNQSLNKARGDKKSASDESATRRLALNAFDELVSDLGLEPGEEGELAEVLKAHIAELTDKVKGGKQIKIDLDKVKKEYEAKQSEAIGVKDAEITELRGDLHATKVSDVATAAITEAKGSVELLKPIVERACKVVKEEGRYVVRVVDAQGDFRSDGSGGWMGVKELVAELKASDSYARAFDSEAPGGTGSKPGSMKQTPGRQTPEMTSTQKIAQGLKKGQHKQG